MSNIEINDPSGEILEKLVAVHYKRAKILIGFYLFLQVVVYVGGVGAVFLSKWPLTYPAVALFLVVLAEFVSIRSDSLKDIAESLKRHHEYWQGFGHPPPSDVLADLHVDMNTSDISREAHRVLREGLTFSSEKSIGPTRVLENLCESAWFSKHLARSCANLLGAVFVVTLLGAICLLLIIAGEVKDGEVGKTAAEGVSITLAFVVSVGVLRTWLAYAGFSKESGRIEEDAQRLLAAKRTEIFKVQLTLSEYQLLRASAGAPLIPTWVWKWKRHKLNEAWKRLKMKAEVK